MVYFITNIYKIKLNNLFLSIIRVGPESSSSKNIYLILVYGITEHPIMLATN